MDLIDVLAATKPVEVEYAGHTIIAEAYMLGRDRLTKEQRAKLQQFAKEEGDEKDIDIVDFARAFLPLAANTLQVTTPDGEESEPSLITDESVVKLPDGLLLTVANKVRERFWQNPSLTAQSESISESSEREEQLAEATAAP